MRSIADRMQSGKGLGPSGRAADAQAGPDGSAKRRKISSAQTPGSELINALDGLPLAPADVKAQTNSHTSDRSALLNLSALKSSLTSGPTALLDTCQGIGGAAVGNQEEAVPAAMQQDNPSLTLPCKPTIAINGALQLFAESGKPTSHSSRHSNGVAAHDRAPVNGLVGLFESFLRASKPSSKLAHSLRQSSTVQLAASSRAATDSLAARKGSETGAPAACSNRAFWSLAALDNTVDRRAAGTSAPAPQPTQAAQPRAAGSVVQQQQMQQSQHCMGSSLSQQAAKPGFSSGLRSTRPAAGVADDLQHTALLCDSAGLSSGSTHQALETDSHLNWDCGTYNEGSAVPESRSTMSQGPEAPDNSGLDVHLLEATPGVDDSASVDRLQHGTASRTPATWAAESSRVASSSPGAPAATVEGIYSVGGIDEGEAVLLLTACMHEGVVEALAVLLHTDGLPFRRPDGSGSLEILLAYMLVVLHRADMLLKLQAQEPHTLLTMIWMAEAFCSQYRNRLSYVLLDYRFYCKGVTYYDQKVQDVLKADTAVCVEIQKEILVASGFRTWVEEPDMDAACQVLRQAGKGAYLVVLESGIADRALQFDAQLQVLLQQQAAAQGLVDTNSKVEMGTVSPEFGREEQQSATETAATQPSQKATRGTALRDSSNTHHVYGTGARSTSATSVAAKGGSTQLPKQGATASKTISSTRMGSKQQLIDLTSKEQALGKRTRSSGSKSGQDRPAAAAAAGKVADVRKNSRQSAGATLSSVWNKLLGGRQTSLGRAL